MEIINALEFRLNHVAEDSPGRESMASLSLRLLQSADVAMELGFSPPLSASDSVNLPQLVPILQLPDGYPDAQVQ